jgi:hypothetical protein
MGLKWEIMKELMTEREKGMAKAVKMDICSAA